MYTTSGMSSQSILELFMKTMKIERAIHPRRHQEGVRPRASFGEVYKRSCHEQQRSCSHRCRCQAGNGVRSFVQLLVHIEEGVLSKLAALGEVVHLLLVSLQERSKKLDLLLIVCFLEVCRSTKEGSVSLP